MKKLLLPLLILISINIQAQSNGVSNFTVENGSLIYRQVFEKEADVNLFLKKLMSTTGITGIEIKDGMIIGSIEGMKIDYKKYGGSWSSAPLVLNHALFGNLLIELKDAKYRVTISNMVMLDNYSVLAASQINPENNKMTLDSFSLNKHKEFRNGKSRLMVLYYMDKHLTDTFSFNEEAESSSSDW